MISVNPKRIKEPEQIVRGLLLHQAGDYARAMDTYAAVLAKHPRHAVAYYLMGLLFEAVNDQHRALELMDRCLAIKPQFVEAHYNRGVILLWLGKHAEARAAYERCIALNANFAPAWVNYGNVLMALGDHAGAIRAYDRAAELTPETKEGIHNRSFVYLLRGQWEQGWADYEARWQLPGHAAANPLPPDMPWWNGEPLEGKRICLVHEQGVGDTLMMLRYVAGFQFLGAHVILRVPLSLERLCWASFPGCTVDAHAGVGVHGRSGEAPWPACDYTLPMMSLPHRWGTRTDTVPFADAPYLVAPKGPAIQTPPGFRVAFTWKGSRDHKNDRNRSTPLGAWKPLLEIPGIAWVCVQQEMTAPERAALEKLPHVTLVDGLRDWGDTAAVLGQVDALVAPDTGIIHLAGALGVTTAVMIAGTCDFRWLTPPRTDSVWYRDLRVYRQPVAGDWATPISELAARLRAIVADHDRRAA